MKTEKQLKIAQAFIEKVAFQDVAFDSDNFLTKCKKCGEGAWLTKDIKHKRTCVIGKILDGYFK